MAEWMEMAGDAYATRVPVKPGVQAYLDRCRAAGERMIVLTSSVPAHCRAALGHLGLLPYFETIIFAHDLGIEKKNPEIYHLAARQLGVRESECTMFDDSVEALRGAKSAGMCTVGVADPYFAREQDALRAVCDRYIESFDGASLPVIKGQRPLMTGKRTRSEPRIFVRRARKNTLWPGINHRVCRGQFLWVEARAGNISRRTRRREI